MARNIDKRFFHGFELTADFESGEAKANIETNNRGQLYYALTNKDNARMPSNVLITDATVIFDARDRDNRIASKYSSADSLEVCYECTGELGDVVRAIDKSFKDLYKDNDSVNAQSLIKKTSNGIEFVKFRLRFKKNELKFCSMWEDPTDPVQILADEHDAHEYFQRGMKHCLSFGIMRVNLFQDRAILSLDLKKVLTANTPLEQHETDMAIDELNDMCISMLKLNRSVSTQVLDKPK